MQLTQLALLCGTCLPFIGIVVCMCIFVLLTREFTATYFRVTFSTTVHDPEHGTHPAARTHLVTTKYRTIALGMAQFLKIIPGVLSVTIMSCSPQGNNVRIYNWVRFGKWGVTR